MLGLLIIIYTAAYIYLSVNKKELLADVRKQVSEKFSGDIQIGNIELSFIDQFPAIAVLIENISIKDSQFAQHGHPLFTAKKVYSAISILRLLQKNNPLSRIEIDDAQLYIYTDTSGYTNTYLFKPKNADTAKTESKAKTEIENITFENVRLVMNNQLKRKLFDLDISSLHCAMENTDSTIIIKTDNDILVHDLSFNVQVGSYLKEATLKGDIDLVYHKKLEQLSFQGKSVNIKDHPFDISGAFTFTDQPFYFFKVATKNVGYDFAKNLLTKKLSKTLSIVKLGRNLDNVSSYIAGPLNGGEPSINIQWKCSPNNIVSPIANFTDCSFGGSFTNELKKGEPRCDENSRLSIDNFSGLYEGIRVVSKQVFITNLTFPVIDCDVKSDFGLSQINALLASNTFELKEGKGSLDIQYKGPIENNNRSNTTINGSLTLTNGQLYYLPTKIQLNDVNCTIAFKNTDVYVNNFRSSVKGNKLVINGVGKNLLAFMGTNTSKANINWSVYSPSINMNDFNSLLQKRPEIVSRKTNVSKLGNASAEFDQILQQANFHVTVKANELLYKKFKAANVIASLGLQDENWTLNQISMQHGGGSMFINGELNQKSNRYYSSNIQVSMENVDINKVMYAFDNFGQPGISYTNLNGKLSAKASVVMDIDRDMQQRPENMVGTIDFSLKNGALLHYEPMKKIQSVIFKKRNFDEIHFAELKDRLEINNGEVKINRMEIQSTALTMFVEGLYSQQGNTDISIQVPLKNLKRRDEDFIPQNKGAESKGGTSIYLRGQTGKDGNVQFKLDVFKKFRKG